MRHQDAAALGSELVVTISKPGYHTARVNVTSEASGAGGAGMAGNILVGGLIGVGIDASSGAMLDLPPNPVAVALEGAIAPGRGLLFGTMAAADD